LGVGPNKNKLSGVSVKQMYHGFSKNKTGINSTIVDSNDVKMNFVNKVTRKNTLNFKFDKDFDGIRVWVSVYYTN